MNKAREKSLPYIGKAQSRQIIDLLKITPIKFDCEKDE